MASLGPRRDAPGEQGAKAKGAKKAASANVIADADYKDRLKTTWR